MSEWRSMDFDKQTELQLLEALAREPETTQADLAAQASVAVGTVNWYLKRWTAKGFVKVKKIGRWRWRYLLTPQGLAEKSVLAKKYVEASMRIYRGTRTEAKALLFQVREAGYESVVIDGEGDIVDICQLTCLELGLNVVPAPAEDLPVLQVQAMSLTLAWPGEETEQDLNAERSQPGFAGSATEGLGDEK
jgi:DNA-binding MarR family transcriptional regulator